MILIVNSSRILSNRLGGTSERFGAACEGFGASEGFSDRHYAGAEKWDKIEKSSNQGSAFQEIYL